MSRGWSAGSVSNGRRSKKSRAGGTNDRLRRRGSLLLVAEPGAQLRTNRSNTSAACAQELPTSLGDQWRDGVWQMLPQAAGARLSWSNGRGFFAASAASYCRATAGGVGWRTHPSQHTDQGVVGTRGESYPVGQFTAVCAGT